MGRVLLLVSFGFYLLGRDFWTNICVRVCLYVILAQHTLFVMVVG